MKKGSALLVVLGMLGFVVMSAIAFSAYMRYSRQPSSFLRRTSSSRLLAKAALAEAIDVIDTSIGNSLFAGQTGRDFRKNYRRIADDDKMEIYDYWQDRVYIGSNALASVESTVATLTTEALAYLPPAIINEARYYSRRSVGGQWRSLGFDSGRYAFTAIDVSDFIDINRVRANPLDLGGDIIYGRNSSDLGRITLNHIFENATHTGYTDQTLAETWDTFMDQFSGTDPQKVPLVSLADMALAMNKYGIPQKMNPFCDYILNGVNFVQSEAGPEAELKRNMTFVTDSWLVPTNTTATVMDITDKNLQPFPLPLSANLQQAVNDIDTTFLRHLQSKNSPLFSAPECVQLYDYLDEDSVPLSLALPTVERTPMITGVGLDIANFQIVANPPTAEIKRTSDPGTPGVDFEFEKRSSTLQLNGNVMVSAGIVFPFKYKRPSEKQFRAQAALTVTFVPKTPDGYHTLRRPNAKPVPQWTSSEQQPQMVYLDQRPAYVMARSNLISIPMPSKDVRDEESDVVCDDVVFPLFTFSGVSFTKAMPGVEVFQEEQCSVRGIKKFSLKANPNGGDPLRGDEVPNGSTLELGWLPMNVALTGFETETAVQDGTQDYCPVFQVWVRIVDENDKTVDLSPANWEDDGLTGKSACNLLGQLAVGSKDRPLLRFHDSAIDASAVKFDAAAAQIMVGSGNQAAISALHPQAYLACDPRFNYAPEDFMACDSLGAAFKTEWLQKIQDIVGDRDGDIFMETSDAGYLQSVYEYAHVSMTSANSSDPFGRTNSPQYNGTPREKFEDCPAYDAMWKTYSQYNSGSGSGFLGSLDVINGQRGFRINPFTQSKNIMMAALGNTPLNWWAASTNDAVINVVHSDQKQAQIYSFSEMPGALGDLKYQTLDAIMTKLKEEFQKASATKSWESIFDFDLRWDDDSDRIFDISLAGGMPLHSVDRKFLHGYWRECFANRQQLFLIFVRAEPMMMGGGALGQTPPQLGARAVALVWRDPMPTAEDIAGPGTSGGPRPHRTRVLFYRQFD